MRPGLRTVGTLPSITVVTMKMLELVARLNVSFNSLLHNYVEVRIAELLIKYTCTKIAKGREHVAHAKWLTPCYIRLCDGISFVYHSQCCARMQTSGW